MNSLTFPFCNSIECGIFIPEFETNVGAPFLIPLLDQGWDTTYASLNPRPRFFQCVQTNQTIPATSANSTTK